MKTANTSKELMVRSITGKEMAAKRASSLETPIRPRKASIVTSQEGDAAAF